MLVLYLQFPGNADDEGHDDDESAHVSQQPATSEAKKSRRHSSTLPESEDTELEVKRCCLYMYKYLHLFSSGKL